MPKSIKRKEGPPPDSALEDLAKPVSEVRAPDPFLEDLGSGMTDDGDMIFIDLDAAGNKVTRARPKMSAPPSTTYRSPGSIFQHIVPTRLNPDGSSKQ